MPKWMTAEELNAYATVLEAAGSHDLAVEARRKAAALPGALSEFRTRPVKASADIDREIAEFEADQAKRRAEAESAAQIRAEILAEVDRVEEAEQHEAHLRDLHNRVSYTGATGLMGQGTSHRPAVAYSPAVEARSAQSPRIEVREGTVYGSDPSVSWVLDQTVLATARYGGPGNPRVPSMRRRAMPSVNDAMERQGRFLDEVGWELRHRTPEGARYRRVLSEIYRDSHGSWDDRSGEGLADLAFGDWRSGGGTGSAALPMFARCALPAHMAAEFRAVSTGSGSMGDFAPPTYDLARFAPARTQAAVFKQSQQADLPASGVKVLIPAVTLAYASGVQSSDNASIAIINPTAAYVTADVQTSVNGMELSQQLLDRSGLEIDQLVARQAGLFSATDIDNQLITAVSAGATTITNSGSFGTATFMGDIAKAAAGFQDTAGQALPLTHVFGPSAYNKALQAQISGVAPTPAGLQARHGAVGSNLEGYTGYDVLGGMWFTDDNLPTTNAGADATILAGDFADGVVVATAEPIIEIYPEFTPATLTAMARYRQYFAIAVLYPAAFATLTGAAYPASPSFA